MKKPRKPKQKKPTMQELPSNNLDMERYVSENMDHLMGVIVDSIEFAVDNNRQTAEPFQFGDTPYVVLIRECDFQPNLEHILAESVKRERFETSAKAKSLLERLPKPRYIKQYKNVNLL